ncbi:MAG: bifunctional precorrin-2 dehydrogenase/sirohydrochlorin ferrochelatase [Candidatus Omnitrophica bacterium]|nr:bifunctional precorrin-2 dehydrogenase/sirohydrochlorin ferrochelatase [Candidatus Omnitrophota bacterium]
MKQKAYYPINVDLKDRQCLVVGGGEIAERKVASLLECDAMVTVVSPDVTKKLAALASKGKISHIKQKYQDKYIKNVFLVIAATDDQTVNTLIARHAGKRNILLNVVDVPELCNFIVPSVIRQGPMVMGISTSGHSPVFAQKFREKCEKCVTPAVGAFVKMMGNSRKEVKGCCDSIPKRKDVYLEMINSPILSLLEQGKIREARQTMHSIIEHRADLKVPSTNKG